MVDLLIRDANNYDRNDTRFPYLRDFDIYAGHDWAVRARRVRRRQQPGVLVGGHELRQRPDPVGPGDRQHRGPRRRHLHLHHPGRRDPGVLVRRRATRTSRPPSGHSTVGMVWGDGGAYATWFSGEPEMIQGINMLPITGGHFYLGDNPAYVHDQLQRAGHQQRRSADRLAGHPLGVPGHSATATRRWPTSGPTARSPPRRARARRTPSTGSATWPRWAPWTPRSPPTTRWPRCSSRTAPAPTSRRTSPTRR